MTNKKAATVAAVTAVQSRNHYAKIPASIITMIGGNVNESF